MRIFTSGITKPYQILKPQLNLNRASLWRKGAFSFSQADKQNAILVQFGGLDVRNSQTLELKLYQLIQSRRVENLAFQLSASDTLNNIAELFDKRFNAKGTQFYCEKGQIISNHTPIEVFLNRSFTIINANAGYNITIKGQLLTNTTTDQNRQKASHELMENLSQLELPSIAQREIEAYFNRVSIWLDAKYGANSKIKMKDKEIQEILVQSIVDPHCQWTSISNLQEEWFKKYVEIRDLRDKKNEALKISEAMATRQMSLGLGLIAANIGFIWSGTYVFFSWDIVEPIAYFTSSLTSIILFGQILKIKKPFSLQNYREYLINKNLPRACEKVGLNLSDLDTKEMQLQVVESIIKDYLIAKL